MSKHEIFVIISLFHILVCIWTDTTTYNISIPTAYRVNNKRSAHLQQLHQPPCLASNRRLAENVLQYLLVLTHFTPTLSHSPPVITKSTHWAAQSARSARCEGRTATAWSYRVRKSCTGPTDGGGGGGEMAGWRGSSRFNFWWDPRQAQFFS